MGGGILSLLWIPSDMLDYYRLNKQSWVDCGLATQAWDKGDGTQKTGGVGMWPWPGSQATFILSAFVKATTLDPCFVPLGVHWGCFDDKGTHSDYPQGLESDSPVSFAATRGHVFTTRLLIRQRRFHVGSIFSISELEQNRPGFDSILCCLPAGDLEQVSWPF